MRIVSDNGNGNGNGATTKLIYWLLGIFGAICLSGGTWVASLDSRIRDNATSIAKIQQQMIEMEKLATKVEAIRDLGAKLAVQELSMKLLEDRYKTMSERLLVINGRMDTLRSPPPPGPPNP